MLVIKQDMARKSPLKTGGVAEVWYPLNLGELALARHLQPDVPVIGALSNTVVFDSVQKLISTTKITGWELSGKNLVRVQCGTFMPLLVRGLAKSGYGGFEYLSSVPGTAGGGVFMNAGRGRGKPSIGERVVNVTAIDASGHISKVPGSELKWNYRSCGFLRHHPELMVVSVELKVDPVGTDVALKLIRERMEFVGQRQDRGKPNLGSVFSDHPTVDLRGLRKGGMSFSTKTPNWIVQDGDGTAEDYFDLVALAKGLHGERHQRIPTVEIEFLR